MSFSFSEPAKAELEEAVTYHEQQRDGLGEEFRQEVESAIQRILDFPEAWPKVSKGGRCCRTKRFPYGVVYISRGDDIIVLAVMHLHRKPGYWKRRL